MNLAIVIPFYNECGNLRTTLVAINEQVDPNIPVYLLDMGSQDKSAELCTGFRNSTYHKCTGSLASGINALDLCFAEVFICRPGVEPNQHALELLAQHLEATDKAATVSPMLLSPKGLVAYTGAVIQRANIMLADLEVPVDHDRANRPWSFKTMPDRALMVRGDLLDKYPPRDSVEFEGQAYPLLHSHVDFDLTLTFWENGFTNDYLPEARIRTFNAPLSHASNEKDVIAFFLGHGDIAKVYEYNDSKEYYGTKYGNFPPVEEWKNTKYEGPEKPKIYVILADHQGCGTYRMKNPFRQLVLLGYHVVFSSYIGDDYAQWCDVIVVQRQVEQKTKEFLQKWQAQGKKVLYEIDDFFHALPLDNPVMPSFRQNAHWLRNIETIIYQSNGLLVSTPELARQYGRFNSNTTIVPNHVDLRAFPIERIIQNDSSSAVRIGWAGSNTHDRDMDEMIESVQKILIDYPETTLVFLGTDYRHCFPNTPLNRMEWIPSTYNHESPVEEYYQCLVDAQIDIGLAPIANNHFNMNKSDIRLIELGAIGIVPVASDVEPYSLILKRPNAKGVRMGFLARNERDWYKYIARLIENPELRKEMGVALQEFVVENRRIDLLGPLYDQIITKVLEDKGHTPKLPEPVHSLSITYCGGITAKKAHQAHEARLAYQEQLARHYQEAQEAS